MTHAASFRENADRSSDATAGARLTLLSILAAHRRLRPHLPPSPQRPSVWLSQHAGSPVQLKIECVQPTGSFKIRGALNALLCAEARGDTRPVVVASAGNHGRAIATAAAQLGRSVTVFVPKTAPTTKREAIRLAGATLRDEAADYDTAERLARAYADDSGALFISPYNQADVIAGAGTMALEILASTPDLSSVLLPLGGGGLASGVAWALQHAAPHVRVIAVEAAASPAFSASLAEGAITAVDVQPSVADGLVGNLEAGSITFELVRAFVDQVVTVSEEQLRRAIRELASEEHLIVEGAGAAAVAALLGDTLELRDGAATVVLITGSNIDHETFAAL